MEKKIVPFTCPACGDRVEAVAWNGVISGFCARTGKQVKALVK